MAIPMRERFAGCMLGHAVGDGLGAPFEGLSSEIILAMHGRPSAIVEKPPVETLYGTDDTHMALAVADVLIATGTADEAQLIAAFAQGYDPKRGYGGGMRRLLEAVLLDEDWRSLRDSMFEGGSYGNGGAMRVAPVGLYFHNDLARAWEEAGRSAAVTHRHPLGVEGTQLMALAVALAARGEADDADHFWGTLYQHATLEEYQWLLRTAGRLTPDDSLGLLGSGLEAHRSVVTAIACFMTTRGSYRAALARALALGNDTDTLMGMAGALAGTHQGSSAVPADLVALLETGERGREGIVRRAAALWERSPQR